MKAAAVMELHQAAAVAAAVLCQLLVAAVVTVNLSRGQHLVAATARLKSFVRREVSYVHEGYTYQAAKIHLYIHKYDIVKVKRSRFSTTLINVILHF